MRSFTHFFFSVWLNGIKSFSVHFYFKFLPLKKNMLQNEKVILCLHPQ